jgi:RHS repeat-associated protein
VKKVTPDGTTLYIGAHYEVRPQPASPPPLPPPPLPPTLTKRSFLPFVANNALFVDGRPAQPVKYYLVGGQRSASRTGSAGPVTYYYHDHLGSTVASSGGEQMRYWPFGATRSGNIGTAYRFTGQRQDVAGLYFYQARWYDAQLGRFLQPDTIVPEPGNPQSLNRYSYVENRPLNMVDPTGHTGQCAALVSLPPAYGVCEVVTGIAQTPVGQQALQQFESLAVQYGPAVTLALQQMADKLPALVDQAGQLLNGAQQAGNTASGNFDPSRFNFDPGKLDPERYSPQQVGQEAHRQFRQEFRGQMDRLGRTEKVGDFLTEKGLRDAQGNVMRINEQFGKPDAVDYVNNVIYELKPWQKGGIEAVQRQYADQIEMYAKLYKVRVIRGQPVRCPRHNRRRPCPSASSSRGSPTLRYSWLAGRHSWSSITWWAGSVAPAGPVAQETSPTITMITWARRWAAAANRRASTAPRMGFTQRLTGYL